MTASDDNRQNGRSADQASHGALRDGIETAKAHVEHAAGAAREKASDAIASGREHAIGAYAGAREQAQSAGSAIEDNPIATLVGGIALGVVLGALLPRTDRETELFGALGRRIQDGAREAALAAREAGQQKFAESGLDRDHVGETARGFVENILTAAISAGGAAFDAARQTGLKGRADTGFETE